jgi:cobalt-zinc-cadmium efflux system protein
MFRCIYLVKRVQLRRIMQHHHHDGHAHEVSDVTRAFVWGIVLNAAYVLIEFGIGWWNSSLALITDAGHNATDVLSLLLSLFAFRMLKVKATEHYTYGLKKSTILASLMNAILLVVAVGAVFYAGIERLQRPVSLPGLQISLVALAGVVVNACSAFLFFRGKDSDINIRGAYLHLLSDALVSLAVVIGGVLIWYTRFAWIDAVLSFLVGLIILRSTWSLLNDSIRLALDGIPRGIELEKIREVIQKHPEVVNVHHIHVWAISSRQNAMTAHLVLTENDISLFADLKHRIKHELEHLNVHHVTLEVELQECEGGC